MPQATLKLMLSFILVLSVSSCSDSTSVEEYIAQAKVAIDSDDPNRALISFKNAARVSPQNSEVRFGLATLYINQGDYFGAEKELERALRFGAENEFIYAKLIETKVKLNKYDEAYAIVEQASSRPDDEFLAVLTYAGIAAIYEGNEALATDYIDRAVGISSDSVYGALGQVYLATTDENTNLGASIKVVNELLVKQPDFIEALFLKGFLLQSTRQYQKAAETFLEYAKLRPKELQVHYLIAQNYTDAGRYDLAEKHVDLLLQINRLEPVANQFKAQILFQKSDFIEAKKHADIAVQQNESLKVARIIAGFSAYKLDDDEQAYQHLIKVKGDVPADHIVNKLLIDLQLRLGYDIEALNSLRNITDVNEMDSSLLTDASYQLLQSGKVEEAKELLKTSISLNSQNPAELAKQGLIQFQLKQSEQGINTLEKALALDPKSEFTENMLAATYLQAEQFDNALKMAKEWQSIGEKAVRGYLLESAILLHNKQVDAAKVLLEKVLTIEPDNISALFKLATFEHTKGNSQAAFSYYSKVLNKQPSHIGAVKNMVNLIRTHPDLTQPALVLYNDMLAKTPEDEFALFGLSYIYKANKQYNKAIETFKKLLDVSQTVSGVELALGDVYKLNGNWDKAIDTYKSYLTANPKNLAAAHKIFSVYEQINQIDKSLEYVEKMRLHYPNNQGLLLLKVYYQSMLNRNVSADELDKLIAIKSIKNHWLFDKVLGNLAYSNNNFAKSASHYQSAYEKESNQDNAINWAKSEGLNNNIKQAIVILEGYLQTTQKTTHMPVKVNVMLASAYLKTEQQGNAEKLLLEVISVDEHNLIALNNLALIKIAKGENQLALSYAEKAISRVGNHSALLDTYGLVLVANKNYDLALTTYDKALAYADTQAKVEILLHKAQLLKLTNQPKLLNNVLSELRESADFELTNEDMSKINALESVAD